jgi:hypothetical protein
LATKLCAKTKEEELIKEMRTVASPEERKVLAPVVFKMIDKQITPGAGAMKYSSRPDPRRAKE